MEKYQDYIDTLKLQIMFSFDKYLEEHLNSYNYYVANREPKKMITLDYLLNFILMEFIAATNTSSDSNIFYKYKHHYKNSTKHIKTEPHYELYRLVNSLCGKVIFSNLKYDETIVPNIRKLINIMSHGSTNS